MLKLPDNLTFLIESGWWPSKEAGPDLLDQEATPLVDVELINKWNPSEIALCLRAPPFQTLSEHYRLDCQTPMKEEEDFFAFGTIEPDQALLLGDFGLGTDSLLILDYSRNPIDPPVYYIYIYDEKWTRGADNFNDFARMLELPIQAE